MPATERTHNLANLNIDDLAAVRRSTESASAVGHWRRILATYGDHLPACAIRNEGEGNSGDCGCGFATAFDP